MVHCSQAYVHVLLCVFSWTHISVHTDWYAPPRLKPLCMIIWKPQTQVQWYQYVTKDTRSIWAIYVPASLKVCVHLRACFALCVNMSLVSFTEGRKNRICRLVFRWWKMISRWKFYTTLFIHVWFLCTWNTWLHDLNKRAVYFKLHIDNQLVLYIFKHMKGVIKIQGLIGHF